MKPPRERGWSILLQPLAGSPRSTFFLASCLWLLVSPTAQAMVDTNSNGVSDLWERQYNDGQKFTTFDPLADPDGDGWTNEREAAAGTDPFEANPPDGFLSPNLCHYPATYSTDPVTGITQVNSPETIAIRWPTLPGKQYTLFYSTELSPSVWQPLEEPYEGNGSTVGYYIPLTEEGSTRPDRLFWRVGIADAIPEFDTDGDSLSNYEEYLANTDPVISDSDGDTLSDFAELSAGTNPNNADEDGDGLTDPFEIAAGTDSKNQDTDGDAIPDSLDSHPLLSAHAFADADDDGIPDADDTDPNNPRGPKPLVVSDNASGNPQWEVEMNESSSFIFTVSNPAGPAPTSSDFKLYLNGTEETANITALTALTAPPSVIGTQRFLLNWNARVTAGYPAQTLQNISLRFKDSQNATSWLNLARVDVAEWEGMIATLPSGRSYNYWGIRATSHRGGVKVPADYMGGSNQGWSEWYRGPKNIPLLDSATGNIRTTAQMGAGMRYPLFFISSSPSGVLSVTQALDISSPTTYTHDGVFYVNGFTSSLQMTLTPGGSCTVLAGSIGYQSMPEASEDWLVNLTHAHGYYGTSGEERDVISANWPTYQAWGVFRRFSSVSVYPYGEVAKYEGFDLWARLAARIIPCSAGTLEAPGLPINQAKPYKPTYGEGGESLLPIQSEQWHKLVLKMEPDAGAVSNGIRLKLGTGTTGENAPQSGFSLQVPNTSGFTPLEFPVDGKIEMLPASEHYQKLVSPEGLTLFLKRDSTVTEFHRLGLDLIPRRATYPVQRVAAMDLPPLDLVPDVNMAGVIGDEVKSVVVGSTIKHFVTPRVTTELPATHVILKVTGIPPEQITDKNPKQIFEWDGGEKVDGEPLKRKVSRHAEAPHVIQIKVKQGGAVAAQINLWVVWTDVDSFPAEDYQFLRKFNSENTPYAWSYSSSTLREKYWRFLFTIKPVEIVTATERPDLSGNKFTSPPGAGIPHHTSALYPSDHAALKWDISRQVELTVVNPNLIPKSKFPEVTEYANQPKATDVSIPFPANPAQGNDDPGGLNFKDEDANPYERLTDSTLPDLQHEIGELTSSDRPDVSFLNSNGQTGATLAVVANFREFARLNLLTPGSEATPGKGWYRISEHYLWHHVMAATFGEEPVGSGIQRWVKAGSVSAVGRFEIPPDEL